MPHIAASRAQRIDLIEEEYARPMTAGMLEDAMQVSLALSDPHFQDVVQADGEKAGLDLSGRRPGEIVVSHHVPEAVRLLELASRATTRLTFNTWFDGSPDWAR